MAIWVRRDKKQKRKANISEKMVPDAAVLDTNSLKAKSLGTEAVSTNGAEPEKPLLSKTFSNRKSALSESLYQRFGGNIRSVLSEGTVINGRLTFDTPVRIDGKLQGEIFSSKALIVGEKGRIEADIEVETLVVLGVVKGKVKASSSIEVYNGGVLDADITTPSLAIDEGVFNGSCKMT